MKNIAKILGIVIVLLMVVVFTAPIIFKDDIKKVIDESIAENINAQVYYDTDGFSLSLIPNFPNFTFSMSNFGIAGNGVFEKDTLVHVGSFEFVIDLMSVINGEQIGINAILLDQPTINVLVLADGQANYDITFPSEEVVEEESEAAAFSVSIDHWQIKKANINYTDHTMGVNTSILGLDHNGQGDFTQDLFDLTMNTTVENLSAEYEGISYMNNKTAEIQMTLGMDLPNATYTFKDNYFKINDFKIGMDGFVAMPGDDIKMDIAYHGKDISIVSLLSLIPGLYQEYLDGVTTGGAIHFDGSVKGVFNDKLMPTVENNFSIENGSIQYADYPVPLEAINMSSVLKVPGENMDDMSFDMSTFSMLLDGEKVSANLFFENLANYTWRFGLDGNLDLEKLMKIVPMDSMTLKGKINAHLKTSGTMALVDAERYDELPASGGMIIKDFYFESPDLPQGFAIASSDLTFTPQSIDLKSFNATVGKSDMRMTGALSNYIGYALNETEVLKGNLTFESDSFDVNEWMTEEEEVVEEDTTLLEVVRLPTNIDFRLDSKLKKIYYDNLEIDNLDGTILVKDGVATLEKVGFNLLEGEFVMDGAYNSVPENPAFDFGFNIKELSIPASFNSFNTIQTMAPIAKNMDGNFSTLLNVNGTLDSTMMPIYDRLQGLGEIKIANATLKDKLATGISKITSSDEDGLSIADVVANIEIKEGRVFVSPFDAKVGGKKSTISGSSGLDGSMDYNITTAMKTGAAGEAVSGLLASQLGVNGAVGDNIDVTINISGTYDNPKIGLGSASASGENSVKSSVKAAASAEIDKQKKIAEEKARAEVAKQKKEAEAKAKAEIAKQKKIAEEKAKAEADKVAADAADKAKNALKGFLKKK